VLVRNFNDLPAQNGGVGMNSVTTHLHNAHTPSESDGFPCDFFPSGKFYDQHYPNQLAGFGTTHQPNGDPNESLGTLWYHDHRVDFTSQNVYKGLTGFYCLFNNQDTGNETTGFRLPGVPDPNNFYAPLKYDVPLMLADRVFDPSTGILFFDLFNFDGILGDKFLVNGKIQPFFEVEPRRYRFRILDRPLAVLPAVPHRPGQQHADPILADRQRRQPVAEAHRRQQRHHRGGPAHGGHHRLPSVGGQDALLREVGSAALSVHTF